MLLSRLEDGALALNIGSDLHVELATLLETHLASESSRWLPLGGGTWASLSHHLVDLLKRQTLGLWNQEDRVHESTGAETSPNEEDAGLEVALVLSDHVWGDDSNDGVPEPVAGSGESDTTRTDWQWEDLANKDPSTRAPSRCEEELE